MRRNTAPRVAKNATWWHYIFTIAFVFFAFGGVSHAEATAPVEDYATTPSLEELSPDWELTPEYIRIELAHPGLYRIYFRDLFAAGMPSEVEEKSIALWNEGELVPLHLEARNPSRLAPEDWIEFIGEAPRGSFSTYKVQNYYNVYFLTWGGTKTRRYEVRKLSAPDVDSENLSFWEMRHLEQDNYYRDSKLPWGVTDNFFWCHYAAGVSGTYPIRIDFPDFDERVSDHVKLTFRILGFSDVPGLRPAHKFSLQYGDDEDPKSPRYDLGAFQFDHRGYYDYETTLPAKFIRFRQRIVFKTPPDRANVTDAISFDWVRVVYPRRLDAGKRNWFVFNSNICREARPPFRFAVRNIKKGSRVFCPSQGVIYLPADEERKIVVEAHDRQTTFSLASEEGILSVNSLELKKRCALASTVSSAAQVLLIYDPELTDPVLRYKKLKDSDNLRVAAVDVRDIFDNMNYGFADDVTLKRFIRYAVQHNPGVRYIVLFGDSTQDYRLAQTFDQVDPPRVGVPIHWIETLATIRASGYVDDNWYASFINVNTPDIAIGRIPAANLEQAFEYVRKVIEYETFQAAKDDGLLVISSVEARFQDLASEIQRTYKDHFTTVSVLFPETAVATREVERLREAIDRGVQVLYYIGHGGAFVWRVGPTDYSLQKDLFTPADVAKLRNALHYPIILASSCYTTAFDTQFSIGEAFLFQPRGGAIAVIGSPWKSSVYEDHAFNSRFLQNYINPAFTRLGDVYQKTKDMQRPRTLDYVDTQTFTLLGDPTLKLVPRK
jgi:hypothetical protein